jgi:hypothetical protein
VKKTALVVLAALAFAGRAAAANLAVSAELNYRAVALGEQLVLSVVISGSGSASPKPPIIPDVEVYESGRSQSMSFINGRSFSSVVHTFVLAPRKTGKFTVPAIEVAGAAPTAPIEFTVSPAAAAPAEPAPAQGTPPQPGQTRPAPGRPAGPDAFVEAKLDKDRALVNEQVTLTVRFFTAVALLGAPQYDAPKLTGLLSENLGAEGHGTAVIGGRSYNYSELKSAMFPVQAGRAAIGPAVVTVQMPGRAAASTGDDFFDRFFSMGAPETRRRQTEPLALQAEARPSGAPDDFSGIVGALTIETSVDRSQLKAGEALNLTVVVNGVGNIKSMPEPKRPDLPSVRFFDSESSVKLERFGDKVGGSKFFKMVVVPRVSGPLEIPPLSVSFFDPAKRAYSRAQSRPIRLTVLPGDPNAALPVMGAGPSSAPGVTEVASDIRYLKAPGGRSPLGDALAAFGAPGPWHALPSAFLLVALLVSWRRRALAANPGARRARAARDAALRRLKEAEAQPDAERARAVALLGEALTGYFADKFEQPAAGLTLKSVAHRLQNARTALAPSALARLRSVWEELDLLRYAPGGAGQAEVKRLADEIRELTRAFDKEVRP